MSDTIKNGKGSLRRPYKYSDYSKNYDEINWGHNKKTISDGFGNEWSIKCNECGCNTMEVVRPGKVQCINCG